MSSQPQPQNHHRGRGGGRGGGRRGRGWHRGGRPSAGGTGHPPSRRRRKKNRTGSNSQRPGPALDWSNHYLMQDSPDDADTAAGVPAAMDDHISSTQPSVAGAPDLSAHGLVFDPLRNCYFAQKPQAQGPSGGTTLGHLKRRRERREDRQRYLSKGSALVSKQDVTTTPAQASGVVSGVAWWPADDRLGRPIDYKTSPPTQESVQWYTRGRVTVPLAACSVTQQDPRRSVHHALKRRMMGLSTAMTQAPWARSAATCVKPRVISGDLSAEKVLACDPMIRDHCVGALQRLTGTEPAARAAHVADVSRACLEALAYDTQSGRMAWVLSSSNTTFLEVARPPLDASTGDLVRESGCRTRTLAARGSAGRGSVPEIVLTHSSMDRMSCAVAWMGSVLPGAVEFCVFDGSGREVKGSQTVHELPQRSVHSLAYQPQLGLLACGATKGACLFQSDERIPCRFTTNIHLRSDILSVCWQEKQLLMGARNGDVHTVDPRGKRVSVFHTSPGVCWLHVLEDDPNFVLSLSMEGAFELWDARRPVRSVLQLGPHRRHFINHKAHYSPALQQAFVVGDDARIRSWSTRTGAMMLESSEVFDQSTGCVVDKNAFPLAWIEQEQCLLVGGWGEPTLWGPTWHHS